MPTAFGRRHFYLILLSTGIIKIHYDDHVVTLDGVYLYFASSRVPYATEVLSENHSGYSCVFTEEFIKPIERLEIISVCHQVKEDKWGAYARDSS